MLADQGELDGIMMQMQKEKKTAEHYLLCYEQEMKEYAQALAESIADGFSDGNAGGGRGNLPGHPVEAQAIANMRFNEQYEPYLWLKAVEMVMGRLSKQKLLFLRLRQEAYRKHACYLGKETWVAYVQRRYSETYTKGTRAAVLSDRTAYNWWNGIIQFVVEVYYRLLAKKKLC